MFDRLQSGPTRLEAQAAPGLPVDRLCVGRRVEEVRVLLPRVFNLCREAQRAAVLTALDGRSDKEGAGAAKEVLRDHLLKFFVTWPDLLGIDPAPFPTNWDTDRKGLAEAVFGSSLRAPASASDFWAFLVSGAPTGAVLNKIAATFAEGAATADGLDLVNTSSAWQLAPVENSVAARHAAHPVMAQIQKTHGRGPLWRAAARLYDIDAALRDDLPEIANPEPGHAVVQAARGSYAIRINVTDGLVTELHRVTPTDHLLAKDGILDRTLASLPADQAGLGALVLDILDPCSPVRLREIGHA